MKNLGLIKFKKLQWRLIVLLLIPVFLIVLVAGIASFVYTRNIMLRQWNESAVLKLQRAAYNLEVQISKPVEFLEVFYKTKFYGNQNHYQKQLIAALASLEGVVRVGFSYVKPSDEDNTPSNLMKVQRHGKMMFQNSRILKITEPEYNSDVGQKTVTLFLTLVDSSDQVVGNLEITMSFKHLLKNIFNLGWWQSDMACIVNKDGRYITHTNMLMKGRRYLGETGDLIETAVFREMKIRPFGTINSEGHPPDMIAGFYKLENIPWTIILFAKGDKILEPIIRYRNVFALGSFFLICIIQILIRLHVGKIVKQIRLLSQNAQKVAKGEYGHPIKVESEDEISQLIHSYNAMVKGLEERDFIRNSFGRYVDPEFAKFLLEQPGAGELGGQRKEVAILMSDIRGFTALSETLSPELIISVLNQYFSHMINIIQSHHGIIVDFFGDAILVFFQPLSRTIEDTILTSIQCASDMQKQMAIFNMEMEDKRLPKLFMGIGINAGQVIVGNIGSEKRAKYGIVGSAVNLTSRIQAKAKANEIIISEAVYKKIGDGLEIQKTFKTDLKGVSGSATLFSIKY